MTCSGQHHDPQGLSVPLVFWAFHPLPTPPPPGAGDRRELWTCCFTNSSAFIRRKARAWAEPQFPHLPSPLPRSGQDQVGVWLGRGAPGQLEARDVLPGPQSLWRGKSSQNAGESPPTHPDGDGGRVSRDGAGCDVCLLPLPGCLCRLFGEGSWYSTGAIT